MKYVFGGIVAVVIGAVIMLLVNIIKATKDPDVIAASNLRMIASPAPVTLFVVCAIFDNKYKTK